MGTLFAYLYLWNILRVPVRMKPRQSEELINLFLFMITSQTFIILAFRNKVQTSLFRSLADKRLQLTLLQ